MAGQAGDTYRLEVVEPEVSTDLVVMKDALIVFGQAVAAAKNFLHVFQAAVGADGIATSEQQDLLRAMLVFSCSGLDATVKQLVLDALPSVIDKDRGANEEFKKFVDRKIRRSGDEKAAPAGSTFDSGFIATALTEKNPRQFLAGALTRSLVGDSLQSLDQLLRVAAHFAITRDEIVADEKAIRAAFRVRNEIVHEMDVDLRNKKTRRERAVEEMGAHCIAVLAVTSNFIGAVGKRLEDQMEEEEEEEEADVGAPEG